MSFGSAFLRIWRGNNFIGLSNNYPRQIRLFMNIKETRKWCCILTPHVILLEVPVIGFGSLCVTQVHYKFWTPAVQLLHILPHRAECHGVFEREVLITDIGPSRWFWGCQNSKHNLIFVSFLSNWVLRERLKRHINYFFCWFLTLIYKIPLLPKYIL